MRRGAGEGGLGMLGGEEDRLPALEQWGDAEVIVGQGGQTAGQRTLVEEPVEGRLVDVGSQL